MEKDIHERENNFFIIEIALVFCLIITVLCFVTCLKHGCQENCGDKYKEENEKLKYQKARMSRMIFSMRNCSNCNGIIYGGQRTEKCKRCEMFSHWEFDDRTEKHI